MKNVWMFLLFLGFLSLGSPRQLRLVNDWKSVEFNFPSAQLRQDAMRRGEFIPGNAVPIDVDVHYRALGSESRLFLAFPRFRNGIPVTLGTRSMSKASDGSFIIDPYPDYSWHGNPTQDCNNRMVSVFRIAIDECQRLWIIDTGKIGLSASPQLCPPKILVFDLNTNRLIHRYIIPMNQYNCNSLFINPIIDVSDPPPGNCANTKAYIADVAGFGILVYDSATDSSWRVQNKLMFPNPAFGTHTISGESFELMDGIFGMAIDRHSRSNRMLYFHALASNTENAVPLSILNNRAVWESNVNANASSFRVIGSRVSQSAGTAIDCDGNLFFGLNALNSIACWDTSKQSLTPANTRTVLQDDQTLQFASGMKVIRNTDGEQELWLITNRFQKVSAGTLNNNEINFRVQAQRITELLDGNKCN